MHADFWKINYLQVSIVFELSIFSVILIICIRIQFWRSFVRFPYFEGLASEAIDVVLIESAAVCLAKIWELPYHVI